ncbi:MULTISPECIES: LptA/OstA family protein [Pseudovibrio]|uniref:LptA/OstA family protein n=1 Tax=Stappiaceae TaxID=2821832 RepID=UPI002366697F|nr:MULTISPECIES: LptA/OstA family protein [Pseudovibrio]MDD7909811.1 LptA/OstA family protein [Pseudovibrio exalbescens]MDX5592151.1 LptA/OstA family protein [Pseudovibrio sp. SPO723]
MTAWLRTLWILMALPVLAATGVGAQTFDDAFAGFGANSDEPIQIEAENLEVQDNQKSAVFSGSVVVSQGDATLKTERLKVFYGGSLASSGESGLQQSISRLEAAGGVFISSKDQTATGDDANFDMEKNVMVMTGERVVLSQGPNVVVGSKLTVNLETGKVDLVSQNTGRVKMLLQPNSLQNNN